MDSSIHGHASFDSGDDEFPGRNCELHILLKVDQHTMHKDRCEYVCCRFDEATFACDAHRSKRVVAGDQSARKVRLPQGLNRRCCPRLQLVFEDHQAEEAQPRLCLLPIRVSTMSQGPLQ